MRNFEFGVLVSLRVLFRTAQGILLGFSNYSQQVSSVVRSRWDSTFQKKRVHLDTCTSENVQKSKFIGSQSQNWEPAT